MVRNLDKYITQNTKPIVVLYGVDVRQIEAAFNKNSANHYLIKLDKKISYASLVEELKNNASPDRQNLLAIKYLPGKDLDKLVKFLTEELITKKYQIKALIYLSTKPSTDEIDNIAAFRKNCALLNVTPLTLSEISRIRPLSAFDYDNLIITGGFSEIWENGLIAGSFFEQFVEDYFENHIRKNFNLHNYSGLKLLLKCLAMNIAKPLNISELCNQIKVDIKTTNKWLKILEEANLIYKVTPASIKGKSRIVKSFKIYFTDTGLASYLANIKNINDLNLSLVKSALFENLALNEIIGEYPGLINPPVADTQLKINFYQEHGWLDIKAIVSLTGELSSPPSAAKMLCDIKFSRSFNPELAKNIVKFSKNFILNSTAKTPESSLNFYGNKFVIYAGNDGLSYDDIVFIPLHKLWQPEGDFINFFLRLKTKAK